MRYLSTPTELEWTVTYYCLKTRKLVNVIKFLTKNEAEKLVYELRNKWAFHIRFCANSQHINKIETKLLTSNAIKRYNISYTKQMALSRKIKFF